MSVYSIRQPALDILDRVGPALLTLLGTEEIAVGGGSALAARWGHRKRTDINITISAPVFREAQDQLLTRLAAAPIGQIRHRTGWLNGLCPEGEFSIAATEPFCPRPGRPTARAASIWHLNRWPNSSAESSGFAYMATVELSLEISTTCVRPARVIPPRSIVHRVS